MDFRLLGIAAALSSALALAVGTILYKRIGDTSTALELNFAKSALSLVLLALVLVLEGASLPTINDYFILGLSGILGISLGDTFLFASLRSLGASTLAVFSLLGQVLTVLLAMILLAEQPSAIVIIGIVLVISGVATVLFSRQSIAWNLGGLRGLTFACMAIVCISCAVILAKIGMQSATPLQAAFVRMLWGTGGLLVYGMFSGKLGQWYAFLGDSKLLKSLSLVVCISTFGGFYLSHVAIKHVDVSIANTLNSTEPLFLLPLAALFLNERISRYGLAGVVAGVLGVVFIVSG